MTGGRTAGTNGVEVPSSLLAVIPESVPQAKRALDALRRDVDSAATYEAIRKVERAAEALKAMYREVEDIRRQAEQVIVLANHRIGSELLKAPVNEGGRPARTSPPSGPVSSPTLAEQVGSKQRGWRLKKLAKMPKPDVERIVAQLHSDGREANITSVLRFDADSTKAARRDAREKALSEKILAYPTKLYGLVVVDDEWDHEVWSRKTGMDRHASNHYVTASDAHTAEQMHERTKARFTPARDCVLAMWRTNQHLDIAIDLMRLRGFRYVTHYVWGKDKIGLGRWNRERHELLLFGVRGHVPCPAPGQQWDSLIMAPRGEHSAKPECFLEMLEQYFPNLPKIEINCRGKPRPGWDAFGDEAEAAE